MKCALLSNPLHLRLLRAIRSLICTLCLLKHSSVCFVVSFSLSPHFSPSSGLSKRSFRLLRRIFVLLQGLGVNAAVQKEENPRRHSCDPFLHILVKGPSVHDTDIMWERSIKKVSFIKGGRFRWRDKRKMAFYVSVHLCSYWWKSLRPWILHVLERKMAHVISLSELWTLKHKEQETCLFRWRRINIYFTFPQWWNWILFLGIAMHALWKIFLLWGCSDTAQLCFS